MKNFLAGLGVGVGLGLVFAPEVGKNTRDKVRKTIKAMATAPSNPSTRSAIEEGKDSSAPATAVSRDNEESTQEQNKSYEIGQKPARPDEAEKRSAFDAAEDSTVQDPVAEILNTASKTKLKTVKGIGEATAKRIIDHRPYDSEGAALEKSVLSEDNLSKLKKELLDKDEVA